MIVGLDTSVVLRLLIGEPAEQMRSAEGFLNERQKAGDAVVVGDMVIAEAYFALQYHYGVSKADALGALAEMLNAGEISGTGFAGKVLATPGLASAKPGFVDRLIHAAYVEAGIAMATFEKAAGRLENTVVLR